MKKIKKILIKYVSKTVYTKNCRIETSQMIIEHVNANKIEVE